MLDIRFEPIGHGRLVFGDADALIEDLSRKANRVQCANHGRRLELEVVRRHAEAELHIRGCCNKVIERAERMLR